jgi:DnaJ domain
MPVNGSSNHAPSTERQQSGLDGRAYTHEQISIVKKVLRAKEGGRGAHYRVLEISNTANESEIKKAYRKLSLKVHPDKVSDCFSVLSCQFLADGSPVPHLCFFPI